MYQSRNQGSTTVIGTGFGADDVDPEFARGAAEYLRRAGLDAAEICRSLVSELGLDRADAQRFARS